ncbi:MAG: hypothetical protein ACQEQR_03540 [Pseudomonadota bacterium]
MWIHYIGEIAIGFFVLLLVIHFAVHFIFKALRIKKRRNTLKQQQEE